MPKITTYNVATTFESGDVLLKDGMYGTKQITADNVAKYIIETYASSNLGGSNRSIKDAIDTLDPSGGGSISELTAFTQQEINALFT